MSSSTHSNNRAKNILFLGKGFIQGINGTTIFAEKMYSISFSATRAKFSLKLHYNGNNSYLFVNGKEMIKFKAKDSEIVSYPFCLVNISKDFSNTNMEKTGLHGSVYYFSIDHKATAVNDILNIHNYLIKKSYKTMFGFIKNIFYSNDIFLILIH